MDLRFRSGREAEIRHLWRADAVSAYRTRETLREDERSHRERLDALPDDADPDERARCVASIERLRQAIAGVEIGAVLVRPEIPQVGSSAVARALSVVSGLEARGWTPPEIAGLRLSAAAALQTALGVVEPEHPEVVRGAPAGAPYPGTAARELAESWLGLPVGAFTSPTGIGRQRVGIGNDELAARVGVVACGSPLAPVCAWPEWIRLGQAGVDAHAALILCDLWRASGRT